MNTEVKNVATITDLKSVKRGKSVEVWVDGEAFKEISSDCAFYHSLYVDQEIELDELKEIFKKDRLDGAFKAALNFIARAMHSKAQVVEYLQKKEFSREEISHAVTQLIDYGYINDADYGRLVLESCINEQKGYYYIKQRLKAKGIERELAEELLAEIDDEQQINAAFAVSQNRYRTLCEKDKRTAASKISQFLSRNGFTWDVINAVMSKLKANGDEYDI